MATINDEAWAILEQAAKVTIPPGGKCIFCHYDEEMRAHERRCFFTQARKLVAKHDTIKRDPEEQHRYDHS